MPPTRRWPAGSTLVLALVAACAVGGCDRSPQVIPYTIGRQGGRVAVGVGAAVLVFEGLPASRPGDGQSTAGTLMCGGAGGSNGHVSVDGITMKHRYVDRVLYVGVNDTYAFEVIEGGRKLRLADRTVETRTAVTVRVRADGTTGVGP